MTNRTAVGYSRSAMRDLSFAVALAMIVGINACGKKDADAPDKPERAPAAAATIDPATTGSISGSVRLDGAPPTLKAIDMSAAPACVKANPSPVIQPQVVTGENGALADVAIYIKTGLGPSHFNTPKDPVVLAQKACMYEPRVVALMVNQKLQVLNDDPTTHNVHVMAKMNEEWNKSQPAEGPAIEQMFSHPELAVAIACNVHPWMRAYAFVFDHPYFAVTTKTGTFEIANVPPGTYTIEAWQERYGMQDQTITLSPRESKSVSFTFRANDLQSSPSQTVRR